MAAAPTRSLDPGAAKEVRTLISKLSVEAGLTVILVTHQLEECRTMAQRYGHMENGKLSLYETATTDPESLF